MNTIRTKIYALHAELSEALFSASKAQEASEQMTDSAKELEIKQRELLKKIGNKENDLDQVSRRNTVVTRLMSPPCPLKPAPRSPVIVI